MENTKVTTVKSYANTGNNTSRYVNYFLTACFVLPLCLLVYSGVRRGVFSLPLVPKRVQADYKLMILQCSVATAVIHLPSVVERMVKVEVPEIVKVLFSFHLFCGVFLGEVCNFFHVIPFWDSVMHLWSGVMLGCLGTVLFGYITTKQGKNAVLNESLLGKQTQTEHDSILPPPLIVALFAFSFSVALGVVWELYEYGMDSLMDLNMQKTALQDGIELVGRAALVDTIDDLILDVLGGGIAAVMTYSSLKQGNGWASKGFLRLEPANGEQPELLEHTDI